MKTIIINIVLCAMLCTVVACDSWLDTTPPSQVPEEDQFGDEFGFRQALIGCYIGMADENLYGCSSYLGTHDVDQVGLELTEIRLPLPLFCHESQ